MASVPLQPTSTIHCADKASSSNELPVSEKANGRRPSLHEHVLFALLDAGVRGSICSKPVRLSAGVKCLTDENVIRLCDLAPTIFIPSYIPKFEDQARFIPTISKCLETFLGFSEPVASEQFEGSVDLGLGSCDGAKNSAGTLQKDLWFTIMNNLRYHESARKLQALRVPNKPPDSILDLFYHLPRQSEIEAREACGSWSEQDSGDQDFDLCLKFDGQANICGSHVDRVSTRGVNGATRQLHDVELTGGGHRLGETYDCPIETKTAARRPPHENRKYSNSRSGTSDASMLLGGEEPMNEGRIIRQPSAIGGPSWLTQNVIRMHPLRQQRHGNHEVDHQNGPWQRDSLYERPGLGWWSDTSDASELPLEDCRDHYTKPQLADFCSSPLSFSDDGRVREYLDLQYDSNQEDLVGGRTTPMSTSQSVEQSNGSLAEVLGNDHLLWHMWKRRASVAPRGEEDVTDMKTLYATDPDMKLFSSRWDLDPSDSSSGSNEDPMLQDAMDSRPSPRDKAHSPMTPNSERRSYFTPTRSSSSSTYVGRSGADPKRKSSLIKRFTWGGRHNGPEAPALDVGKLEQRTIEVKRRKTLDDYDMMDREASNDDSSDMLF
ncbi:uncharacterized protein Z520_07440 [Fonsecaea multimorphosa CBS 102226]|uniref:Uncharacterized protein n=1 Tax=Fonsecaea multimorphosa CBS 102226 TaxID=1442371 RepID=A0A0D2II49_9EURO|nr:uncharacterized protein Z520_07440 [Fonsecaea multimorphosa CBS 102226]KIX96721.1 hypothetical protein Z520_07440 [Fonsecaea multimorphosa CBS 102226]OAL22688.1 hypothetical protein AYO22_06959 [Fonsecaea multimorphosa]